VIGPAPLALGAGVSAAIAEHARQTYPNECCGALIGRAEMVTEAFALPNTTEEGPRRRFLVRAEDCTLAENRAKAQGAEVLGFYHSHPDAPARPSQYDLDHAWPTWWYVIVAVEAGEPVASTCWRLALDRSKFEQQRLLGDPLATRPGYVEDREASVR
jgi:proteasome lid subunit RPN8/RPN11